MRKKEVDLQLMNDRAYTVVKKAILNLDFKPGQQLSENILAYELGLSKTPIRDALWRLCSEGLVEQVPFKGFYVVKITLRDVEEIFELRETLEVLAVRDAALEMTEEESTVAENIIRDQELALRNERYEKCSEKIREFHDLLISKMRNSHTRTILRSLDDHMERIRNISVRISGLSDRTSVEHRQLLEILRHRDPDAAEQATRKHIRGILEDYVAQSPRLNLTTFNVGGRLSSE